MNLVLIAVMVAVMYFIVLRPQMKRQKERRFSPQCYCQQSKNHF